MAQPGRAVLCPDHAAAHSAGRLHERVRSGECDHGLPGAPQCGSQTLCLDGPGLSYPGKGRPCETSVRVTTLEQHGAPQCINDLSRHVLLSHMAAEWQLEGPEGVRHVRVD